MKTLFIVRHGKSSWDDLQLSDIERPLKKRGVKNAKELGTLLKDEGAIVDLVLTSPATRAFDTANIVADYMDLSEDKLHVMESLYMPDFSTLLKAILYTDDTVTRLMVVGHEPSISSLIGHFVHRPPEKIVTASLTRVDFDCASWKDIQSSCVKSAHHRNRHDWKGYELS